MDAEPQESLVIAKEAIELNGSDGEWNLFQLNFGSSLFTIFSR